MQLLIYMEDNNSKKLNKHKALSSRNGVNIEQLNAEIWIQIILC